MGYEDVFEETLAKDHLVVGSEISEAEAIELRLEIRPAPNGDRYVWVVDEINPNEFRGRGKLRDTAT